MTPIPTDVLVGQKDSWQKSSHERWRTIRGAIKEWKLTFRLCVILFVAQIPVDISALAYLFARR